MFRQPTIFLYHELCDDLEVNDHIRRFDITHSLKQFEAHVPAIVDHFDLISAGDFLDGRSTGEDMSDCALITFDDGYYNSCLHGMGILEQHGCGGIWFINSDFSNDAGVFWLTNLIESFISDNDTTVALLEECFGRNHGFENMLPTTFNDTIKNFYCEELAIMCDRLPCVVRGDKAYLNDNDIKEFSKLENCYFANHTASHPNISKITSYRLSEELSKTCDFLVEAGTSDHGMFAIPFGLYGQHWTIDTLSLLLEMGYPHVFSVCDEDHPTRMNEVYKRHQVPTFLRDKEQMTAYINQLRSTR